jgi:hypothetical protein
LGLVGTAIDFSVIVTFSGTIFSGITFFIGVVGFIFAVALIGADLTVFAGVAAGTIILSSSHTGSSGVGCCFANSGCSFFDTEDL